MTEQSPPIEISASHNIIWAVTFSANGEYLVSGDEEMVQVWRVKDGRQMATLAMGTTVHCLAVSKDGRWIGAGSTSGVGVWDAGTYEPVFAHTDTGVVTGIDFSPSSASFVVASFNACTATILNIATDYEQLDVQTLCHERQVIATKYSPQGDRIATATHECIRIWDSKDGRLFTEIKVRVIPEFNNALLWFNNNLFVVSYDRIKQFDASSGSELSEWPVPSSVGYSCIALLQHGELIAYSTSRAIMFWNMSTHTQLALIHHPSPSLFFIAISPDDRFLAVGGRDGEITIKQLSRINEPDIQIDGAALDSWKNGQFVNAEAILSRSTNPNHHVLASRALVRAQLRRWDAALVDAEMAINIQPSVIGYVAKSIALVGKGEKYKCYAACDIASEYFHSSHVSFLLLIKAIILFMAGEHRNAISRMDDLIAAVPLDSMCYVVQAYMYTRLGNSQMQCNDYEGAIQSFERARAQMQYHTTRPLFVVSLITGWEFDDINIVIRRHLCEALYAAGRTRDAAECFRETIGGLGGGTNLRGENLQWAHDFKQRFSAKMKHLRDVPVEGYKSCLPTYIATSNGPVASNSEHRRHKTSHLPRPIRNSTMERTVTVPRSYSPDLDVALRLYDRLRGLTGPWCAAGRMKLPCIAFRTPPFSPYRTRSDRTHRADTLTFGMVEVKTRDNLSQMNVLYLVHPCLSALLERGDTKNEASLLPEPTSLPTPVRTVPMDRKTQARQLVARLRQPFGALLLTLVSTDESTMDYRRVASDSLITVRFQQDVSLAEILDNVRVLDVL